MIPHGWSMTNWEIPQSWTDVVLWAGHVGAAAAGWLAVLSSSCTCSPVGNAITVRSSSENSAPATACSRLWKDASTRAYPKVNYLLIVLEIRRNVTPNQHNTDKELFHWTPSTGFKTQRDREKPKLKIRRWKIERSKKQLLLIKLSFKPTMDTAWLQS